jgi:hypothetical protein
VSENEIDCGKRFCRVIYKERITSAKGKSRRSRADMQKNRYTMVGADLVKWEQRRITGAIATWRI